jgi:hypothetical protein
MRSSPSTSPRSTGIAGAYQCTRSCLTVALGLCGLLEQFVVHPKLETLSLAGYRWSTAG